MSTAPPRGLGSATSRFQQRAVTHRRRSLRTVTAVAVAVALLLGAAWAVLASPLFRVSDVEVTGVSGAERSALAALAQPLVGTPLARVDVDGLQARVASRPEVRSVSVERSWPATVTLRVVQRTPAVALKAGTRYAVADVDGVVFAHLATPPAGIPVVTAAKPAGSSADGLAAALRVVKALPADLARRTTAVTVSSENLVTLKVGSVTVVWGGPGDDATKAAVVRVLLRTPASVIDVSAPQSPVTR